MQGEQTSTSAVADLLLVHFGMTEDFSPFLQFSDARQLLHCVLCKLHAIMSVLQFLSGFSPQQMFFEMDKNLLRLNMLPIQ